MTKRLVLATAATALVLLGPAASADAATFHLWGCRTPSGVVVPTDGWAPRSGQDGPGVIGGCALGGGLSVVAGESTGLNSAAMTFSLPPSLRAKGGTIYRFAQARLGTAGFGSANGAFQIFQTVQLTDGGVKAGRASALASSGDDFSSSDRPRLGTSLDPFADQNRYAIPILPETENSDTPFGVVAACSSIDDGCDARYVITAYDFVLEDSSVPTVKAVGGTLLDASGHFGDPTEAVTGKQNVVVVGADSGSGVYRAIVKVDGGEVAAGLTPAPTTGVNRCSAQAADDGRRAFVLRQPCPSDASVVVNWDSSNVPDGKHSVEILLEDAAGNQALATSGTVLTHNNPNVGPGSLLEFRGAANGSKADDASHLSLTFPATERAPSKRPSVIRSCKKRSWAAKHPLQCAGRQAQAELLTTWSKARTAAVTGTLRDSGGQPVAKAKVEIFVSGTSGASARELGAVTTDAAGSFGVQLPRADGSQSITAHWLARANDTVPAAVASAILRVKAGVAFDRPRSVLSGDRATFRGSIPAAGLPQGGRTVSLQYRRGHDWATFAEPSTDASGHWVWRQRFSQRANYRMRVLVRALPTYPFEANTSRVVALRVR